MCIAPLRTVTFRLRVGNVAEVSQNDKENTWELDYNNDTSFLGRGDLVIADFNETVNVQGYDPAPGSKAYRTISGEIVSLHPVSGGSFHLVIHQAIPIPTLKHHLLCPMQCRVAVVTINDCPTFLTSYPQEDSHYIIAVDEYKAGTVIPLALQSVTSILNVFRIAEWG